MRTWRTPDSVRLQPDYGQATAFANATSAVTAGLLGQENAKQAYRVSPA